MNYSYRNLILCLFLLSASQLGWALSLESEIEALKMEALTEVYSEEIAGIEDPKILDQFQHIYPLFCQTTWVPPVGFDPGRVRSAEMMNALYGQTQAKVESQLTLISWLGGQKIRTTKVNGVAQKFSEIASQFMSPDLVAFQKYLYPSEGSYNRRFVAGTNELSSHSWGHGIDINLAFSNYWKWELKEDGSFKYKNRIPCEVVKAFEAKGFIWGGKWYHYDTMHFEYRPELILFAKKFKKKYGTQAKEIAFKAGMFFVESEIR